MNHCSNVPLIFTLFFYFAACSSSPADSMFDKPIPYAEDAKDHTDGCPANMRLFGPNNQYRCNCKDLQDCDFANNGKCKNKCNTGFKGPFCQRICYDHYLANNEENVNLIRNKEVVSKSKLISFNYLYRINSIKIDCSTSASSETVTLYIGSKEFCKKKCLQNITCTGDEIGKNLHIKITGKFSLASLTKMKVSGCSPYWFGKECDKQCHCLNNQDCHKLTGNCPNGCEKGRSGPDCQKLNYENVARNKKASQNTTYPADIILQFNACTKVSFGFSADLAVDGNIDQQHERHSCMHTRGGRSRWSVYLGKKYNISQIRIYNRNINTNRIINAVIYVGDDKCYEIKAAKKIYDIKCDRVIAGKTVTITQHYPYLNFCEVEVLQCLPGFYGDRCSKRCSTCKDSSCDQWTGRCVSGCVSGYWQNDNQPCAACSPSMFGENCAKTCHCKDNINCDKETGICRYGGCETGYQGEDCQERKMNIFIPIIISLSVLLLIISGIVIYFIIKKKEDKMSASGPRVIFVKDYGKEDPDPLKQQESLYTELE